MVESTGDFYMRVLWVLMIGWLVFTAERCAEEPCPAYNIERPGVLNRAQEICSSENKIAINLYYNENSTR